MTIVELLILLLVAGICGGIAQSLVGYSRGGCLTAIVLGFIGAMLGTWIAKQMSLPEYFNITIGNKQFPILWSIIGASLFVAILSFLSGRKRLP